MPDLSYAAIEAELRQKSAPPFPIEQSGTFGVGIQIDAKQAEIAPGEPSVTLDVPLAAGTDSMGGICITERVGHSGLTRILFPRGRYRCPARLALWPSHQHTGPHGLHQALHRLGVEVVEISDHASSTPPPPAPGPAPKYCAYCGRRLGRPHASDCPTLAG
jgi:hypothetical protein